MRLAILATFIILGVRLLPAQVTGDPPAVGPEDDISPALIARIKDQALPLQWTMGFMQSIAQGDFRTGMESINAPATGYGFGFEIGQYFDPVPVFIGAEASVVFYPSKDREISPSSTRKFSVNTSNFKLPILTTVRFQPSIENWVYPYAELIGGITFYSSDVTVRTIINADTTTDSPEGRGDHNWNYGVGLGALVKVADVITLPNSLQRTLIDIRFRYITGSSVTFSYADLIDDSGLDYTFREVRVDRPGVIMFRLGVTFHL